MRWPGSRGPASAIRRARAPTSRRPWPLEPDDVLALEELIPFFRATGRIAELAESCERAGRLAAEPARRAALWAEAGELHRTRLSQPDRAEQLLSSALEAEPRHRAALEGLLALAESRRDGATLCRCLKTLAELAADAPERLRTLRRLAVAARDLGLRSRARGGGAAGRPGHRAGRPRRAGRAVRAAAQARGHGGAGGGAGVARPGRGGGRRQARRHRRPARAGPGLRDAARTDGRGAGGPGEGGAPQPGRRRPARAGRSLPAHRAPGARAAGAGGRARLAAPRPPRPSGWRTSARGWARPASCWAISTPPASTTRAPSRCGGWTTPSPSGSRGSTRRPARSARWRSCVRPARRRCSAPDVRRRPRRSSSAAPRVCSRSGTSRPRSCGCTPRWRPCPKANRPRRTLETLAALELQRGEKPEAARLLARKATLIEDDAEAAALLVRAAGLRRGNARARRACSRTPWRATEAAFPPVCVARSSAPRPIRWARWRTWRPCSRSRPDEPGAIPESERLELLRRAADSRGRRRAVGHRASTPRRLRRAPSAGHRGARRAGRAPPPRRRPRSAVRSARRALAPPHRGGPTRCAAGAGGAGPGAGSHLRGHRGPARHPRRRTRRMPGRPRRCCRSLGDDDGDDCRRR